ncbi:MAG: FHA domain-containing protein [Saprospiraceae bacterium]|nr:FHA domain-containing protein [Saprospiraceae bacterium]
MTGAVQEMYALKKFNKGVITLGRASDGTNDIEIKERNTSYISRKQCTLEKIENDWLLRDGQFARENGKSYWRNSPNGTLVNNVRLKGRDFYRLGSGDLIHIGDCVIQFDKY